MSQKKQYGLALTLHRKLVISFSLSSVLIIVVGAISYLFSSMREIMIVTSAAVAVTMITGFVIYRSITKPLDNIKARVSEIALKNFEVDISESNRCDELGDLARSITQMKEHLKEKDRQKDEFINIASHELRTPIQPIVAYIELARKGVVPPTKAFEVISMESLRLKRLADDILDVSRIEGKRLVLKKESFSVNEVLAKLVESARTSLKAGEVTMTFKPNVHLEQQQARKEKERVKGQLQQQQQQQQIKPVPATLTSDYVFADKYRIIQVITNILNNAVKFTKRGTIEISTKLIDGGNAIEISVSDTGGGIPDEIFPKLFDKFATKGVNEGTQNGTGLGLFISQSIIKEHDGSIVGLNNDKGGATFRIILPTEKTVNDNQVSTNGVQETSSRLQPVRDEPAAHVSEKVVAPHVRVAERSTISPTSQITSTGAKAQ